MDGLSLQVNASEIFSLLGPNGAGKSSLINILTTLYKPTSGNVTMLGKDLNKDPDWVRTQIACVAQNVSIDEHLSLMENMIFQSRLYKVDNDTAKKKINTLIDSFGLSQYLKFPWEVFESLLIGGNAWMEQKNNAVQPAVRYAAQHHIPVAAICDANIITANGTASLEFASEIMLYL